MTDFLPLPLIVTPSHQPQAPDPIRQAAEDLEQTFLAEMLKSAGLGAQSHAFSGGIGEEQFASFQRDALARELVQRGGIGLAETFYNALKEKADEHE